MNNIDIQENINSVNARIDSMRQELLRLEGSLRVFQQLRDAGVTDIPLGKQPDILATNEVIDTVPIRRKPSFETLEKIQESTAE